MQPSTVIMNSNTLRFALLAAFACTSVSTAFLGHGLTTAGRIRTISIAKTKIRRAHNALPKPLTPSSTCLQVSLDLDSTIQTLAITPLPTAVTAATAILLISAVSRPKRINQTILDQITANTNLQNKPLGCVYRGSRDGWSAVDFHNAVDNCGSAIVVISANGKLFGGYNPAGWRSTDDYYSSSSAFLWSIKDKSNVVKFPILPGGNAAVFDYATSGPCFGAQDLVIGPSKAAVMGGFAGPDMENTSTNAGNLQSGRSTAGGTYDTDQNWPARGLFQISELEVYCSSSSITR